MKYMGTLIAVTDLQKSKAFYRDILSLKIRCETPVNITFNGCIVLQKLESWAKMIKSEYTMLDNHASELYFETKYFDIIMVRLSINKVKLVHSPVMRRWGQRIVRFYDPDHHIIEVGEAIDTVVKRFKSEGLSDEEIAKKMNVTIDFVRGCLENEN